MKCCKDCQWYFLDERIKDEKGKHVCYGHFLVSTPFLYADSIEEENQCDSFKKKQQDMTKDELFNEWWNGKLEFDESTEILSKSLMEK